MKDALRAYARIKYIGACIAVVVFGLAVVFLIAMGKV